jgi:hypothetical protein
MQHESCRIDSDICRAGLCHLSEFSQQVIHKDSTFSPEELKELKRIIVALQDIYDSTKKGSRHREMGVVDLIEEQLSILELIKKL